MSHPIRHRGKHPQDEDLFAVEQRPQLIQAAQEMAWLLERDYSFDAVLKLVGDRYSLRERQRLAVGRAVAPPKVVQNRQAKRIVNPKKGCYAIDTFNTLLTVEAKLSESVILRCHDGTYRDMASVHGTYRTVEETTKAIEWVATFLSDVYQAESIRWLIDKPVSNSGRLKKRIEDVLEAAAFHFSSVSIDVVPDPDYELKRTSDIVITSDSVILDNCLQWANLLGDLFAQSEVANSPDLWLIEFGVPDTSP
jgi:hypothetical protein